jgi:hypothetical protein
MGMATEIKHGAQADFEGRGSCEDPLTSRLISEHRGLEGLFLQYEQLPSDTDPQVNWTHSQQQPLQDKLVTLKLLWHASCAWCYAARAVRRCVPVYTCVAAAVLHLPCFHFHLMLQERLQLGYEMIRQISLHAATGRLQ